MESWQKQFLEYTSQLKRRIDHQKLALRQKLDWIEPVTIQPYIGFGGRHHLYIRGRVLEQEGLEKPKENDTIWQNAHRLYHRFVSSEIPYAPVAYIINSHEGSVQCDNEGYFEVHLRDEEELFQKDQKWQNIQLKLLRQYNQEQEEVCVQGEVMIRQSSNRFGLISDVDDTIILTKATDFLEKLRILLLNNAHSRKPFEGIGAFYRALEAGKSKDCQNPIFYVSSASWNLYDLFDQFCSINNIPKGAFLLQDLGLDKDHFLKSGHMDHKITRISQVLEAYDDLPFILIGDSGQKDPEIYQKIVSKYPGRIKVIYIRDVTPEISDKRDEEGHSIADEIGRNGVEMVLVHDSLEAARHAVKLGLIPEEALEDIEQETYEDKQRPSDISQLLGLDKLL
jgi:phosphatidate phosphatase APP1